MSDRDPAVKERPILFSGPMVNAILEGRKTQTRRVVKDLPPWEITEICKDAGGTGRWMPNGPAPSGKGMAAGHWRNCPYGQPGDRLWVRETWQGPLMDAEVMENEFRADRGRFLKPEYCVYAADGGPKPEFVTLDDELVCRWRPSIHMYRWASRILLEITDVRVERLNDISEADAKAEGAWSDAFIVNKVADYFKCDLFAVHPSLAFRMLWESINGADSWAANPWVWVVEFRKVEGKTNA